MEAMLMMTDFKSIESAEHSIRAQFRIINQRRSTANITQGSYSKGKKTEKKARTFKAKMLQMETRTKRFPEEVRKEADIIERQKK